MYSVSVRVCVCVCVLRGASVGGICTWGRVDVAMSGTFFKHAVNVFITVCYDVFEGWFSCVYIPARLSLCLYVRDSFWMFTNMCVWVSEYVNIFECVSLCVCP